MKPWAAIVLCTLFACFLLILPRNSFAGRQLLDLSEKDNARVEQSEISNDNSSKSTIIKQYEKVKAIDFEELRLRELLQVLELVRTQSAHAIFQKPAQTFEPILISISLIEKPTLPPLVPQAIRQIQEIQSTG